MTRPSCLAALGLWLCGLAGVPAACAASPPAAASADSIVRHAAQAFMREQNVPGLAIALSIDGRHTFYTFGVASETTRQPVTRDTLFEIGSISKTFTATLAAYAQATGKLSLRDPVERHLPELAGSRFGALPLFHLATHTAGGFPLQVPDDIADTAQLLRYLNAWQPRYAAGTRRTYANPSIGMLGVIAARSLRMPFEPAAQALYARLGLHDTYLAVPAAAQARYAQGYNRQDAPVRLNPGVLADEAYGVKTSTRDLLHFVDLNLGSPRAAPPLDRAIAATHTGYFKVGRMTQGLVWEQYAYPATLDTLLRGNAPAMALQDQPAVALDPPLPARRDVLVNKTGATNGFGAYVAFIPARRIGLVILANKSHPNDARVRLAWRILEAVAPPAQPGPAAAH